MFSFMSSHGTRCHNLYNFKQIQCLYLTDEKVTTSNLDVYNQIVVEKHLLFTLISLPWYSKCLEL
jgi:hypothetical protein